MPRNPHVAILLSVLAIVAVFTTHEMMSGETEVIRMGTWLEEGAGSDGVVDAIADLKAYCSAAKLTKGDKSGYRNSVYALIKTFGSKTKKDIVTQYAQTIGDLKVKFNTGLGSYLLDEINHNVLAGRRVVTQGIGTDKGFFLLDHEQLGLRNKPVYFSKLKVATSQYSSFRAQLTKGTAGKALAMWAKSGRANAYQDAYEKLTAKYMAKQEAQNALDDQGAKVSIQSSYVTGDKAGKGKQEVMLPLPVAGSKGGALVASKPSAFKMPSAEEIRKEAMAEAMKVMAKIAKENSAPDAVVAAIEAELEGTTIKMSTSNQLYAESYQSPTVEIEGTMGTIKGTITALPLPGKSLKQTFSSPKGSIGVIKNIIIKNDKKVANPWMVSGFSVQVGHGSPWVELAPQGKSSLMNENFWLDGSNGKQGPYYRRARQSEWLLLPTGSVKLSFVKQYANKEPICVDVKCVTGSRADVEKACREAEVCNGYTYTAGKNNGGSGCLKKRCHKDGQYAADGAAPQYRKGLNDYWVKKGYSLQNLLSDREKAVKEKAKKELAKKKEIKEKEMEKKAKEKAAKKEAAAKAKEKADKAEKAAKEKADKAEKAEKELAAKKKEKADKEMTAKEKADKVAAEKAAKVAAEKAAKAEKADKAEKAAKEAEAKELAAKAKERDDKAKEQDAKEKAAKQVKEQADKAEKAAKEKAAKDEKAAKEATEKHKERVHKDAVRREKADKVAAEKAAKAAAEAGAKQEQAGKAEKNSKAHERNQKQEAAHKAHTREQGQKEQHAKEIQAKQPVMGPCTCEVKVYSHNHYGGHALGSKTVTGGHARWHGISRWNIHSILVNKHCDRYEVEDDDANWDKHNKVYHGSNPDLPWDLEDDVRTIGIWAKGGNHCCVRNCPHQPCTGIVRVYQHQFSGWEAKFFAGDYNVGAATSHGFRNDDATSVRVPPNCKVELYQHGSFNGWKAVVGPGDHDLASLQRHGFRNDDMSSLRVMDLHRL